MTTDNFIKCARKRAREVLLEKNCINVDWLTFEVVWMTHTLGNKKCLLYSPVADELYIEVTYNVNQNQMYVDVYTKLSNTKFEQPLKGVY